MNNIVFNYTKKDIIGLVNSVDTGMSTAVINDDSTLSQLQVNQLLAVQSPKSGRFIIAMIIKIYRKASNVDDEKETDDGAALATFNQVRLVFVGEFIDKIGTKTNVFRRNVSAVPSIDAPCYKIEHERLTNLMQSISSELAASVNPLQIGKYTMDESSIAYLDADKLFQRHAAIVGSTGSGKSFCVARIVEQMAALKHANGILFDIHGEYSDESFKRDGILQLKIATPSDLSVTDKLSKGILMVPYWLLNYEEMQALLLDRSDQNAPNQAMLFSREVLCEKEKTVNGTVYDKIITVDSPVAYNLQPLVQAFEDLDTQMVPGAKAGSEKQGPFYGKLTRFIQRVKNKLSDKRMGFMFSLSDEELKQDWLDQFCAVLMDGNSGIKVIDMSEVPSDVLPLVIGLLARIVFSIQQWSTTENRHPIALLCDEAHLYVQQATTLDAVAELGLRSFERIAKEGRKYGVGLVIISQRPSEVNRTVLSQCNNFISLRLTNVDDQNVIKRLLPDNLGNIADNLSLLDIAEAIIVGDSTLLPSRVKIDEPSIKPSSQTIPFWSIWSDVNISQNLSEAIGNMIKQSK
ncbi:MAG: ATP-binding protein [Alloprevotella sp.]